MSFRAYPIALQSNNGYNFIAQKSQQTLDWRFKL